MVEQINSGGQTGADQGGLAAGCILKLKTGGMAPKGYLTEVGNAFWLSKLGLTEHMSSYYWPRTMDNVRDTDGTIIFGNPESKGCVLTKKYIERFGKPGIIIFWKSGDEIPDVKDFIIWIRKNKVKVLNVAGNRESYQPGIFQATRDFLVKALSNFNAEKEEQEDD